MRDRYGLFRLHDSKFAVPLARLLRVVESGRVVWLPLMPETMAGAVVVDEELVPMLDSSWLPAQGSGAGLAAAYQVLIATEFGPVALPADTTVGIVAAGRGEWAVANDELNCEELNYFLPEVFRYRGSVYPVLNVDMLIMSLTRS